MICAFCGKKGARIQRVARLYGAGRDHLIVEDVPVVKCPHCHERYLDAATMHALDQLRRQGAERAVMRPVSVVSFQTIKNGDAKDGDAKAPSRRNNRTTRAHAHS